MTAPAEDFTELVDADIPRVDLVGKAANGTRFLLRKAADDGLLQPLVPAEQVRALIAKTEETTVPEQPEDLAKAAPPVEADDLVETAPGGSTADSLPGSPDWEQLDGDTAMNAVATLGRVKACLQWLSDREAQEAVTGGDADDADNSFDLCGMADQIDCIIGRLAGFAVGEHMEADMADELEEVGKAVAAVAELAAPLGVIEGLAPIAKAGRVLSAANEAAIRTAVDSLTGVLNSLPQAPTVDDGTAVTKETAVTETTVAEVHKTAEQDPDTVSQKFLTSYGVVSKMLEGAPKLTAQDVLQAALAGGSTLTVAKAKGDPQLAVFDENGKLIGTVDPADLSPIASSASQAADAGADVADDAEKPADDTPAEPAAPEAEAAPAERTVPGTHTVQAPSQAPDDTQTPAVAKTADTTALEEDRVAALAKQVENLAADNEALKETVRKFGMQPDDRRSPVLNGATGTPGAVTRDPAAGQPLTEVLKAIEAEPDPVKRDELRKAAFFTEVKARFEQA